MPKDFFKYLLWALVLHGAMLGAILFSWPFFAQSVFSFDQPRIYKVSLVSLSNWPPRISKSKEKSDSRPKTSGVKRPEYSPKPNPPEIKSSIPKKEEAPPGFEAPAEKKEFLSEGFSSIPKGQIEKKEGNDTNFNEQLAAVGKKRELHLSFSSSQGPPPGSQHSTPLAVPRYGENRSPYYPAIAREQGWQGTALLKVQVLKTGTVGSLELLRSSGYAILDRSALKAVKDWKFIPAYKNGQPIDIGVEIPVTFRLE